MSSIKTNIPLPIAPLTGPDGRVNEVWWRFFLDIFNRTGGGTGNDGTVDPVYPDISSTDMGTSTILSTQDTAPSVALPNGNELLEALYVPIQQDIPMAEALYASPASEPTPVEMILAPLISEGTNVSFISVTYSGQLTSTIGTGTPPMVVSSTTKVANLNADLLDGSDWSAPPAIGTGTPNSASFTTINTSGNVTTGNGTAIISTGVNGSSSGLAGGGALFVSNSSSLKIAIGNKSGIIGGAYDGTPYIYGSSQIEVGVGLKVPGGAQFLTTSTALTNGAAAGAGTITNAPAAGNPTKWIGINDNGTIRYIPSW
jgi:hypothetical protein